MMRAQVQLEAPPPAGARLTTAPRHVLGRRRRADIDVARRHMSNLPPLIVRGRTCGARGEIAQALSRNRRPVRSGRSTSIATGAGDQRRRRRVGPVERTQRAEPIIPRGEVRDRADCPGDALSGDAERGDATARARVRGSANSRRPRRVTPSYELGSARHRADVRPKRCADSASHTDDEYAKLAGPTGPKSRQSNSALVTPRPFAAATARCWARRPPATIGAPGSGGRGVAWESPESARA